MLSDDVVKEILSKITVVCKRCGRDPVGGFGYAVGWDKENERFFIKLESKFIICDCHTSVIIPDFLFQEIVRITDTKKSLYLSEEDFVASAIRSEIKLARETTPE